MEKEKSKTLFEEHFVPVCSSMIVPTNRYVFLTFWECKNEDGSTEIIYEAAPIIALRSAYGHCYTMSYDPNKPYGWPKYSASHKELQETWCNEGLFEEVDGIIFYEDGFHSTGDRHLFSGSFARRIVECDWPKSMDKEKFDEIFTEVKQERERYELRRKQRQQN